VTSLLALPLNPSEVKTIPHIASLTTVNTHTHTHTKVLSPELSDVFWTARIHFCNRLLYHLVKTKNLPPTINNFKWNININKITKKNLLKEDPRYCLCLLATALNLLSFGMNCHDVSANYRHLLTDGPKWIRKSKYGPWSCNVELSRSAT
jgi:hypothetical protein